MSTLLRTFVSAAALGGLLALAGCGGDAQPEAAAGTAPARATAPAPPAPPPAATAVSPTDTGGGPRRTLQKTSHDFGTFPDTQRQRASFSFTNTGTGKLVIETVKSTCGCTVPSLNKYEFLPGEGSTIHVEFDPSGRAGPQTKQISVVSNAQPNLTRLTITGNVQALLRRETHLLQFGTLPLGRRHTRRVNLFYTDPDLEIRNLQVTNPHVTAHLVGQNLVNSTGSPEPYAATIEVVVSPDAPWGMIQRTKVTFDASGRPRPDAPPESASYSILVTGQLYGDLRPDPPALYSRSSLSAGDPYRTELVLSRTSGASFTVTNPRFLEPVPGAELRVEPEGASWRVIVEGRAPDRSGAFNGTVTLRTDVPGEEDVALMFSVYVKG